MNPPPWNVAVQPSGTPATLRVHDLWRGGLHVQGQLHRPARVHLDRGIRCRDRQVSGLDRRDDEREQGQCPGRDEQRTQQTTADMSHDGMNLSHHWLWAELLLTRSGHSTATAPEAPLCIRCGLCHVWVIGVQRRR